VSVIMGMDPHKRSATIEVINELGDILAGGWRRCASSNIASRTLSTLACWPVKNGVRRQARGGHSGTTLQSSVTGLTPDTGPSDKPQPEPATRQPTPVTACLLT
jgi:hypothetical protein